MAARAPRSDRRDLSITFTPCDGAPRPAPLPDTLNDDRGPTDRPGVLQRI